jgi:hypothetical protein
MTYDELRSTALPILQTQGYDAAVANIALMVQQAVPTMSADDALGVARQVLPAPAVGDARGIAIEPTFFDKYKWYIIITMLIIGAGGMYWSYSKLKNKTE